MRWIWLVMTCMVRLVIGLNSGRGCFLNFVVALKIFLTQKCISCGYWELRWLNNVGDVYFVQVPLLLIGQQGSELFFRYRPLLVRLQCTTGLTLFCILGCSAALPAARRAAPGHAAGRAAPRPPPADADAAAASDAAADAVADAAAGPDAGLPGAGENEQIFL
jgi:hypothetical protein